MAVHIKLFSALAERAASKRSEYDIDWRDGLTARDILAAEGFRDTEIDACMAIINDEQGYISATINDGDFVTLGVAVQGG